MKGNYQALIASLCHSLSDEEAKILINVIDSAIYRAEKEGDKAASIPVYQNIKKGLTLTLRNPKQLCSGSSSCNAIPATVRGRDSFVIARSAQIMILYSKLNQN